MKKHLLTFGLLALGYASFAQFTPGNLAVVQAGNDGTTETNGMTIHVKEFTLAGTFVQKISLTSTGANSVVFGTPGATTEGLASLSADRQFLTFMGYNADAGTSSLSGSSTSTVKRAVAVFKADGTYTTANFSVFSGQSPRTVVTNNGTDFWMGGGANGMRYGTTADLTTTTSLFSTPSGYRAVSIFNNELYFSTTNSGSPNPDVRIGKVSGSLPTAATTYISLPGLPTTTITPHSFVFLDSDGNGTADLLYVGLDGGLQKYFFDSGTSTWVDKGLFATPSLLKGLNAHISAGSTTARIYAIEGSGTGNKVVSITDNAGFAVAISAVKTDLTTAPAGTVFKGLTYTPGTTQTSLPVKLTSFEGRQQLDGVKLNWATASEQNNSHFNVLRANDSKKFKAIAKVAGNGTSNTVQLYNFTDRNPYAGNNYYQLEQVDLDGKTEKSTVVAVKTDLKDNALRIKTTNSELQLTIFSDEATNGAVSIVNVTGQKVSHKKLALQSGYTETLFNISSLSSGVYVVSVVINGKVHSQKFVR